MAPPVQFPPGPYRSYAHPTQIRRGCCLSLFLLINALTVLSALSVAVAEILSVIYHDLSRTDDLHTFNQSDLNPQHTHTRTHTRAHTSIPSI